MALHSTPIGDISTVIRVGISAKTLPRILGARKAVPLALARRDASWVCHGVGAAGEEGLVRQDTAAIALPTRTMISFS